MTSDPSGSTAASTAGEKDKTATGNSGTGSGNTSNTNTGTANPTQPTSPPTKPTTPAAPPPPNCVYSHSGGSSGGGSGTVTCATIDAYECSVGTAKQEIECSCTAQNGGPWGQGSCKCNGNTFAFDCANACSPSAKDYANCNLPEPPPDPPGSSGTSGASGSSGQSSSSSSSSGSSGS